MASRSLRIGLGLVAAYVLLEGYLYYQTKKEIALRNRYDTLRYASSTVGGVFVNPFPEYRPQTLFEFAAARILEVFENFYGTRVEIHDKDADGILVEEELCVYRPNLDVLREASAQMNKYLKDSPLKTYDGRDGLHFTWLGQSCLLIQMGGINFLTDPQFSHHLVAGALGPRRLRPLPMSVDDVIYASDDRLDFVIVLHDHPDHLDLDAASKIGNRATWIVPLGLRKRLARRGIYKVVEMDWWDTIPLNNLIEKPHGKKLPDDYELVCVPAMHWLGRYVIDSNKLLWASFIIRRNGELIVYHAGDTGYTAGLFADIAEKYAPVFLALLPIGQYCPSWHQKPRHISPGEAIDIARTMQAASVQGIHWGTFKLSLEPIMEPKRKLMELASKINASDQCRAPEFGITYCYDMKSGKEEELHLGQIDYTETGNGIIEKQ